MSAFLAEVLSPVFAALAPRDPARVARRVRNAAAATAVLGPLLPRYGPLGTGTVGDANLLMGVYAVAAVAAHMQMKKSHAGWRAAGGVALAGIAPFVTSGMTASWGLLLGSIALLHAALSDAHSRLPAAARPEHEHDPLPPDREGWPGRIGSIAYSIVTVLIFWHFVAENTVVPTDSMKPTILGATDRTLPDRLFADVAVYALREPRRWEILVFEYPLQREVRFVKRIVGLPGEHVEIRDGDIWIDGSVARKPALVQESLWRERFPKSGARSRAKSITAAWTGNEDDGWRRDGKDGLKLRGRDHLTWARFLARLDVGDVRIAFTARTTDAAAVAAARITTRGVPVVLEVGGEGGTLTVGDDPPVEVSTGIGAATRVELQVADGLVRALLDGHEVARAETAVVGTGRNRVEIGGGSGEVRFTEVRLDEDIRYALPASGLSVFDTPADGYVVLGDNTTNSEDSRMWTARPVRLTSGETYWVAPSVPDETGERVSNLSRAGGRVRFKDVDGVPRDFAAAEVTEIGRPEARPYVRRSHVLGRAALLYFPIPPLGGWRPRLLP